MIPADLDKVYLFMSREYKDAQGKMILPMKFLSAYLPPELWLASSSPRPRP
jgi:hypothetical protein